MSIVVVDFGGERFLPELLDSLGEQSYTDFELMLIDNGCAYEDRVFSKCFPICILRPQTNLGFAEGSNWGWREARGELVVFLNNDVWLSPDWLEVLVKRVEESSRIGAVCSKVLFYRHFVELRLRSSVVVGGANDPRELGVRVFLEGLGESPKRFLKSGFHPVESDGASKWAWSTKESVLWAPLEETGTVTLRIEPHPDLKDSEVSIECGKTQLFRGALNGVVSVSLQVPASEPFDLIDNAGGRLTSDWNVEAVGNLEKDDILFSTSRQIEFGSACSMIVRRSSLEGEVPFDREFFAYYEDVDLSARLERNGYCIFFEPNSVVRHHGSGTAGVQSAFQVFHSARNRFWVIAKHAPWKVVFKSMLGEMRELERYDYWLDDEYSLSRLKRETWLGFLKRLWWRLCDSE